MGPTALGLTVHLGKGNKLISFIKAYTIDLILSPEITHLGGCVEIILPSSHRFKDSNPVEKDRII